MSVQFVPFLLWTHSVTKRRWSNGQHNSLFAIQDYFGLESGPFKFERFWRNFLAVYLISFFNLSCLRSFFVVMLLMNTVLHYSCLVLS